MKNKKHLYLICLIAVATMFSMSGFNPDFYLQAAQDDLGRKTFITEPATDYVEGEVLVKFKDNVSETGGLKILSAKNSTVKSVTEQKITNASVPQNKSVEEFVTELNNNPAVEFAEPNYIYTASYVPNDTYFYLQWNFHNTRNGTNSDVNMPSAWNVDQKNPKYGGAASVVVAVVDTGVSYENYGGYKKAPDFAGTNFTSGYDYINGDAHPNDDNGHGTHVSGTIAQATNNNLGTAGIAFNTTIMPVKVLDDVGWGPISAVADGINYAVNHGADVINLSLGGSYSATLKSAIDHAISHNVIVVAAAGNGGGDSIGDPTLDYPASHSGVIAVGATRYDATRASYSNYGSALDIMAPGGDTSVDQNGDGHGDGIIQDTCNTSACTTFSYQFWQGTSMATPHVSGAVALMLAKGIAPANIWTTIKNTATDLGAAGRDNKYGYGLINISAALNNDSTPPAKVSNFTAIPHDGFVSLTWDNPSTNDFAGVKIRRKTSGYPSSVTDGTSIYSGSREYKEDTSVTNGQTYYYSIFSYDEVPNYSAKTKVSAMPNYLRIITGSGPGSGQVRSFGPTGTPSVLNVFPYGTSMRSGVNVAACDIDGDGADEVITAPMAGAGSHIKVYEADGSMRGIQFFAFHPDSRTGTNIACGDTDGDGKAEIAAAQAQGGQAWVKIYRYNNDKTIVGEWNAFGNVESGASVAMGDVDNDGKDEVIVGAGPGGGPQIRVFEADGTAKGIQFFAFHPDYRGGVDVGTGDYDGDGKDEIVVSQSSSSEQAWIKVYRYNSDHTQLGEFKAYGDIQIGAHVDLFDIDEDGRTEILTAAVNGGGPHIRGFEVNGYPRNYPNFFAYDSAFRGGADVTAGLF
ncbi:MAG: S8 family serine peptidase [bacterium]